MDRHLHHSMTAENPHSILEMILFLGIGQLLMLIAVPLVELHKRIFLFDILSLDVYLMIAVHLLSAISFVFTIILGIPKAWKVLQTLKIFKKKRVTRRRKKL